MVDDTRR
jgi:hypothetical protein